MERDLNRIIKDDEEIAFYLDNVSIDQFKTDIEALKKSPSDKQLIKDAIAKLQELL